MKIPCRIIVPERLSELPVDSKNDEGNNRQCSYFETNEAYKALFGKPISISLIKESASARATPVEYKVYNPKVIRITNVEQIEHFVPTKNLTFYWETDLENKDKPMSLNLILRSRGRAGSIRRGHRVNK